MIVLNEIKLIEGVNGWQIPDKRAIKSNEGVTGWRIPDKRTNIITPQNWPCRNGVFRLYLGIAGEKIKISTKDMWSVDPATGVVEYKLRDDDGDYILQASGEYVLTSVQFDRGCLWFTCLLSEQYMTMDELLQFLPATL